MPSTLRDLSELTTVADDDMFLVSDTSDVLNRDKKISRLNLLGTTIAGGGSINTGNFDLTIPATGTAVVRDAAPAPVAGNAVRWEDSNKVEDAGVAFDQMVKKTGTPVAGNLPRWLDANTMEDTALPYERVVKRLAAAGVANELVAWFSADFVRNTTGIPYTDVGRKSQAQSWTGIQTFPSGISVGGGATHMTIYDQGSFAPRLNFSTSDGGYTTSVSTGTFVKIGTMVYIELDIRLTSLGTAAGAVRIIDLPYTPLGNKSIGFFRWTGFTTPFVNVICQVGSGILILYGATAAAVGNNTAVTAAHLSNTSSFLCSITYTAA